MTYPVNRLCAAAVALVMIWAMPVMAAAESPVLLVVSKTDNVLEMRNPDTFDIITRIPISADGHEVALSADGKSAYVSHPGYGAFHEISVIDVQAQRALPSIDTFPLMAPHGLAVVGDKLWLTAQGSKSVARYDLAAGRMDWVMGTGQDMTHMIHVTADGQQVYTTNVVSGTVSLFENKMVDPPMPPTGKMPAGAKPRMDWVQTIVPLAYGAEGFDVSPDGREIWIVTPDGRLWVIDTAQKKLVQEIADEKLDGGHRLAFFPDGARVMVVSVKTGALAVYDTQTRKAVKHMTICQGAGIYMDAPRSRAFISCTPNNQVAVIDLQTLEQTGGFETGRPDGIAVTP